MDWGLIGTILAIVFGIATIISIIIAVKLARRRLPVWGYQTKKIIGLGTDAPQELKLFFNGTEVLDVFRTTLIFYNKGNEAIRKEDISRSILLKFGGATVLHEPNVRPSTNEIGFWAKQSVEDNSIVKLDFSYLDHNDGAVIEVLHTKCNEVQCDGNIIGAGKPKYIGKIDLIRPRYSIKRIVLLVIMVLFPFLVLIPLFIFGSVKHNISDLWIWIPLPLLWYAQFLLQSGSFFRYLKFPKWSHVTEKLTFIY